MIALVSQMKKHLPWYNLLFLEFGKQIKWDTPVEDLDHIRWDLPVEELDQIGLDTPVEDPDTIRRDTPVEDLEKDIQSKDANPEDADSEDVAHKDAVSLDTDLLFRYFNDLKHTGPLLDREQQFWLAMDIQAGLRMSQAISSDGISGIYGDLRDNWEQYSAMIESLRLPSIDWDRVVSVIAQQRLNKECVRFSEIFPWLKSANDHTEIRQKLSWHTTRIYLDLVILPVATLLMIAGHFAKDDFALPNGNEIDRWFKADPTIEWPVDEIYTQADRARERLILSNLLLVISIAKKYRGRGVEFEDLIQQGNLGLILTIDKYDPSKGYKFSTYAYSWIRKEITRYISNYSGIIRLPEHVSEKRKLVYKASERLYQQLHRTPTENEMAETLGSTTANKVATLLNFDKKPKSLDEPIDESNDDVLGDFIEDPDQTDRLNVFEQHQLSKDIQNVLNTLSANRLEVITLRFGIHGQECTFKEVGDHLGVPWEQIRKIEDASLEYLRYPVRLKLLREYME